MASVRVFGCSMTLIIPIYYGFVKYIYAFSTTIGHHDPVGVLIIAPGLHSPCGRLVYQGYVVGMYPNLSNIGRYWGAGFNFVNAIQLLRPNSFHLIWAPGESTGSAELLAF